MNFTKIVHANDLTQWNVNKPRQMSRLIAFQHHQTHTLGSPDPTERSGWVKGLARETTGEPHDTFSVDKEFDDSPSYTSSDESLN